MEISYGIQLKSAAQGQSGNIGWLSLPAFWVPRFTSAKGQLDGKGEIQTTASRGPNNQERCDLGCSPLSNQVHSKSSLMPCGVFWCKVIPAWQALGPVVVTSNAARPRRRELNVNLGFEVRNERIKSKEQSFFLKIPNSVYPVSPLLHLTHSPRVARGLTLAWQVTWASETKRQIYRVERNSGSEVRLGKHP